MCDSTVVYGCNHGNLQFTNVIKKAALAAFFVFDIRNNADVLLPCSALNELLDGGSVQQAIVPLVTTGRSMEH